VEYIVPALEANVRRSFEGIYGAVLKSRNVYRSVTKEGSTREAPAHMNGTMAVSEKFCLEPFCGHRAGGGISPARLQRRVRRHAIPSRCLQEGVGGGRAKWRYVTDPPYHRACSPRNVRSSILCTHTPQRQCVHTLLSVRRSVGMSSAAPARVARLITEPAGQVATVAREGRQFVGVRRPFCRQAKNSKIRAATSVMVWKRAVRPFPAVYRCGEMGRFVRSRR